MASAIVTPAIRTPLMEERGHEPDARTATRDWWLYFESLTRRINAATKELAALTAEFEALKASAVTGADSLTTLGAVPMVGPLPGELEESSVSDDGTNVSIEQRNLLILAGPKTTTATISQVHFRSSDTSDMLDSWMEMRGDPVGTNRRLAFGCVEQSVGWRNITLAESGGNVGIGTANPLDPLHVHTSNLNLRVSIGSSDPGALMLHIVDDNGSTLRSLEFRAAKYMFTAGKVGLGVLEPAYDLQLGADSAAKPGTNTWTVASDGRLKRNVRPFDAGLETLLRLRPAAFEYNGEGGMPEGMTGVGLVAQEAAEVIPSCVRKFRGKVAGVEEDLLGLNTGDLTWMLINAVRQLEERLRKLEEGGR